MLADWLVNWLRDRVTISRVTVLYDAVIYGSHCLEEQVIFQVGLKLRIGHQAHEGGDLEQLVQGGIGGRIDKAGIGVDTGVGE